MTYRHISFPIQLGRPVDSMILGARAAVSDVLRGEARAAVSRAGEAGVDAMTLGQRLVMSYMQASQASKFLRGFPPAAARWCFMVEQHGNSLGNEGYPVAPPLTIGGYDPRWITVMPHNVVMINAGGVRATGVLAEGQEIAMHETREVRISRVVDLDNVVSYVCTVIMSSDSGRREGAEDPADLEPQPMEREDL